MLNIRIGYPTEAEEMEIVARTTGEQVLTTECVLSAEDLARAQSVVRRMPIAEHVMRHALRIVRATRAKQEPSAGAQTPAIVRDYVAWGAGPRASQFLVLAAKAKALLSGDSHVETRHLHAVSLPVLRHRIVTNFNAEADGVTSETIIQRLIDEVPVDAAADGQPLDRLIR
jgi:MoxR-like ATPase